MAKKPLILIWKNKNRKILLAQESLSSHLDQ